jgi:hypothetical protein
MSGSFIWTRQNETRHDASQRGPLSACTPRISSA